MPVAYSPLSLSRLSIVCIPSSISIKQTYFSRFSRFFVVTRFGNVALPTAMRATSFVEPVSKRTKLSIAADVACLHRERAISEKRYTSGTSAHFSDELPVDDEWEDDFLFTQPEVLEMVDASVNRTIQEKEARRSAVRELCKPESSAFAPQFAASNPVIANGTAGRSMAPQADDLMVSHQLTLDRISQDCNRYKSEIEDLRRAIMTKEGEVKILREWKLNAEREELRRQSQAYAKQQLETQKMQELEQKHAKEVEALKTQLKFLEREKNSIEEKLLEARRCRRQSIECQSVVSAPAEVAFSSTGHDWSTKPLDTRAPCVPFPDRNTFYDHQPQAKAANVTPSIVLPNRVALLGHRVPSKTVCSSGVQTDKVLGEPRRRAALRDRLGFGMHLKFPCSLVVCREASFSGKEVFNLPVTLLCHDGNVDSHSSGVTVGERLRLTKPTTGGLLSRHQRAFWT